MPEEAPYRGPGEYQRDNYSYLNEYQGGIENFSGQEKIMRNGKKIYTAKYIGGFVDQR